MTTIKVEILGTGCKKCQQLEANAKEAVRPSCHPDSLVGTRVAGMIYGAIRWG